MASILAGHGPRGKCLDPDLLFAASVTPLFYPRIIRNSLEELSMNRVLRLFSRRAVCGVLFFWATILGATSASATDKVFVSRTAEIDGVKLHYTTGGHGTPLILLHGYAETSRMWTPILPLLGDKFTVIAPDLPGIGDSEIPANGLDMKTATIRIHAL